MYLRLECSFSKRLWRKIMALWLVSDPCFCWEDLLEWGVVHLKGTEMRDIVCKVAWWATGYSIWSQRNAIIHAG